MESAKKPRQKTGEVTVVFDNGKVDIGIGDLYLVRSYETNELYNLRVKRITNVKNDRFNLKTIVTARGVIEGEITKLDDEDISWKEFFFLLWQVIMGRFTINKVKKKTT